MKFKILLNTFFQLAGKFISSGTGFLTTIILARVYTQNDFGEFVKITAFVSAFWIMGDFGLNAIILQKYSDLSPEASNDNNGAKLGPPDFTHKFNSLLSLRLLISLFLMFLCISLLAFLPKNYTSVTKLGIILMSFTIMSQDLHLTTNSLFQHHLKYQFTLYSLIIVNLLSLILVVACVFLKLPIIMVTFSYSICGLVLIMSSFFFARRFVDKFYLTFNFSEFKKIFLPAIPLGLVLIFNVLYFHLDSFLLAVLKTNREVAQYGLAYKFFETLLVIPTFYGNSVYPVLLARLKNDQEGFRRLFRKSLSLLALLSILTLVGTVLVAPLLIGLSTGFKPAYAGSITSLQILALSFPVYFITSIFMWYFVSLKKNTMLLWVYGSSLVLNFVLNWFFIPRFGFYASAWLTGLCEAYILVIFIVYFKFVKIETD